MGKKIQYADMFRPPGLVKIREVKTNDDDKSKAPS